MADLDPLESVAASELVSSALIASLIPTLVEAGVLSEVAVVAFAALFWFVMR